MTTKVKSSHTSKSARRVNSATVNAASVSISAPAGAGSTAGGVAPIKSGAVSISHKVAKESINDRLAAAAAMNEDYKVTELRTKIAACFAAPEWSGAAAVRAALSGLGLNEEQIQAAVAAAARKSGVDLSAPAVSVARVLAVVRRSFRREFEQVVGCSFATLLSYYRGAALPAGSAGFSWSLALPLSLVVADSEESDFVTCSRLAAGSSAAAVVAGLLSFRWLVSYRRTFVAAGAAARKDLNDAIVNVVRSARRLGLTADWLHTTITKQWEVVPQNDEKERRRLNRSLDTQTKRLANINYRLMVVCPAICEVDTSGDFFVSAAAVLPAGAGRAARRLFALRRKIESNISTLRGLLSLGC